MIWVFTFNCAQPVPEPLEVITYMPKELKENSGLAVVPGSDLIWTINDSGNKDHLYGIDIQGSIIKDLNIKGASNKDWEDLATDPLGNIYIADIGNNNYKRDELVIYKLPNPAKHEDDVRAGEIIYKYPGYDKNQPFNAEAVIFWDDQLYIFTKSQKEKTAVTTKIFSVPAVPGSYTAIPVTEIPTCEASKACMITAADISPDGNTLALLSQEKIWIGPNFLKTGTLPDLKMIDLHYVSQKEGLCFIDNKTLFISDERNSSGGGMLYRLNSLEGLPPGN